MAVTAFEVKVCPGSQQTPSCWLVAGVGAERVPYAYEDSVAALHPDLQQASQRAGWIPVFCPGLPPSPRPGFLFAA